MQRILFENTVTMNIDDALTMYLKERGIPESSIVSITVLDNSYGYGGRLVLWCRDWQ